MQESAPINCDTTAGSKGTMKKGPEVLLSRSLHLPRVVLRSPCHQQEIAKERASGGDKAAPERVSQGDSMEEADSQSCRGCELSGDELKHLI